MKKIYILLFVISFLFVGCTKSDASKFKEEYESLNGTSSSSGQAIRNLDIPKNNPIVYSSIDEVISKIEAEDTFVVYFGFASCPWCRSMINTLIDVALDLKVKKVYYVDVLDVRDVIKLVDGQVLKFTDASDNYYKLLTLLDDVLENYTITGENGDKLVLGEKRIYAPNVVVIKNGKALDMTTGISEDLTDPYMELTDEIKNDSREKLEKVFKELYSCSDVVC